MSIKLRKIFSFFAKKKPLLLVFFFVILGTFYPLKSALAGPWADLGTWIATRPIAFIVWILRGLAILLVKLTGSLLNWVLSPGFTTLSYTNPAGNKVIEVGLDVTRGFVNMLLVIILIYIAIATILRLAGYETKKLLVTFIIVALLVNFSPVICGLIVDASNIIMNFFVQDLKADAFGTFISTKVETITNYDYTSDWHLIISSVIQTIVLTGFLFVLFYVLLIFILIFVLRHLIIWVLVILSPLAFVCYILPVTKKYFEMWWEQFLAWSFIGVTCGFFLYLGLLMVTLVPTSIPSPVTGENPLFNSILPYFVSVVFLGLGVIFGLKTSAMGAGSVIGFVKTKGKVVTTKARGMAWKGTKLAAGGTARGASKVAGKIREGIAGGPEGQKRWREWGEKQQTIAATKSRFGVSRYARRAAATLAGGRLAETQQTKIKKIEESKDIKGMERTPELLEAYNNSMTDTRRIAVLNKAIEKGKIGDLMNEKYGAGALKEDEMKRILKKATSWDADSTISKAFPHLAATYVTPDKLKKAKDADPRVNNKIKFVVSKMKQKDYENVSETALKNVGFVNAVVEFADGKGMEKLIEKHGKMATDEIKKLLIERAKTTSNLAKEEIKPTEYLKKVNPGLYKYLSKSPGVFIDLEF